VCMYVEEWNYPHPHASPKTPIVGDLTWRHVGLERVLFAAGEIRRCSFVKVIRS
jgi:hypothetical protein